MSSARALPLCLLFSAGLWAGSTEVSIQVPVDPRIDTSRYDSILVMNFLTSNTEGGRFDLNEETVKFMRNELKGRTNTKVLDPSEAPALEGSPEQVFSDASYWQHVGALFPGALILSGRIELKVERRSGFEAEEVVSPTGALQRVQRYKEGKYFILGLDLYFIDGSSGATVHHEDFREEMMYDNIDQPALYGYYDMMDRVLPRVLGTVIAQKYQETRYLLE